MEPEDAACLKLAMERGRRATLPEVGLFGPKFADMFRNAVAEVGSYADIYDRNAEAELSRGGLNTVNFLLRGPQHYPLPGIV